MKLLLATGALLIALSSSVSAQTINTTTSWDGSSSISAWDVNDAETIGQTVGPTSSQTKLSSFTFELSQIGGTTPMQYQAFVYQWNSANKTIMGPALFTSGVLTAPTGLAYTPVTINTGSVALTAGLQYMLFFTTTSVPQVSNAQYQVGKTSAATYIAGGALYSGSGSFSSLGSLEWEDAGLNLAFIATFASSSLAPPPLFLPLLPSNAPVNPTNVAAVLEIGRAHV